MKPNPIAAPALLALLLSPAIAGAITLAEAERAARTHDPDIQAARIELRGSEGDLIAARRRPPAELELGTSKLSRYQGLGPGGWQDKRADSTVGIGWTLERGGKRRWRTRNAQLLVDAARLDVADAQRQQRLALHEAYFGLKAARQLLQAAQENRALSARALAATQRQVQLGASAPIELSRLTVEDLKIAAEARDAEQELLQARADLALLIGYHGDIDALDADDPWPPATTVNPTLDDARLRDRADLRAAEARVQAADAARALARSQRRRDLQLGVEAEREPGDLPGLSWGLSLSVPLNGPNHYRGELLRAEADYDAAVLERDRLRDESRLQAQQALRQLRASTAQLQQYEQQLSPAARQALDGMELAYRRGAANLTDLLDARRAWREADNDLIAARFGHAVALARWHAVSAPPSPQGSTAP